MPVFPGVAENIFDEGFLQVGDYVCRELEGGTWEIADFSKAIVEDPDLEIPSHLDYHHISRLGDLAFSYASNIQSVTIPYTVTDIGIGTFFSCGSLTSVTVPDSVTGIGELAFAECPLLTLTVGRDSCTARYAEENGLNYLYANASD